ncbi:iron-sulfur cluster biosynthesis family protein [Gracilibacillus thailandensis]|uniref:Iron-sulfur cluster biosynthesis family protein n=1 Tax=Gracilibacillus thailandensis TaxID=563735 RepID=A0A6N7R3J1_9BACI|nr:iron-sulfur cluster biosynthesis family protein [Gracilibacillus thailandensis]MRI67776.1 iron-sulfur cluster biosynthesis family protein [Gracilibacillus thailandensis]
MQLMITENALDKINSLVNSKSTILALTYDTEGCGCGVNGMPTISLIPRREANHIEVECDQFNVVVHHQEATFFSENMKLDYNGATFRLTSPNEMLNPFIHIHSVIA